jgi:hypothetical protein
LVLPTFGCSVSSKNNVLVAPDFEKFIGACMTNRMTFDAGSARRLILDAARGGALLEATTRAASIAATLAIASNMTQG